jgi:glycosyltransferase involved in cell wall biosynthesis
LRVLIFHGYLLGGTGSNVYNARLTEALLELGHEAHLLCQDRHPERYAPATAAADWDGGELRLRALREAAPGRPSCTLYRPAIGRLLPVYVQDDYEGVEARAFADCSDEEIAAYLRANVEAVREVAERTRPDVALANHLVMGPAILARALDGRVPYAVKIHGSALEYTVKPEPERFLGYAREGLAPARTVLVGSTHTAQSLWRALGDPSLPGRTRLGPPGVDVARFVPRARERARADVEALAQRLRAGADAGREAAAGGDTFARDTPAVADALERLLAGRLVIPPRAPNGVSISNRWRSRRVPGTGYGSPLGGEGELIAFVGKLIAAKGVDLLLDAWPSVLERRPRARLVLIGFGAERERLQAKAAPLGERAIFTGRLEHDELSSVLPLCEALVVPSTFPEAFGMVAVEAAACGVLPISAAHSGLAEVSEQLAHALPSQVRGLLSFPIDEDAPAAIAARVLGWLEADEILRERARRALVATARERWSWQGVARGAIAAALGQSDAPLARTVG